MVVWLLRTNKIKDIILEGVAKPLTQEVLGLCQCIKGTTVVIYEIHRCGERVVLIITDLAIFEDYICHMDLIMI